MFLSDPLMLMRAIFIGLVHVQAMHAAYLPNVRTEPRLDDNHAARQDVPGETLNRFSHARRGPRVADRTAETEDNVEAAPQVEVDHVGSVEGHAGQLPGRDLEHVRVKIETFDHIVPTKGDEVGSGTAGDVEQRIAQRLCVLGDESAELVGFGRKVVE